jgi:membrane-bound lytic murein transglycosylase D
MKSTSGLRRMPGAWQVFWVGLLTAFAAQAAANDSALPCPALLRPAVHFWIRVYTQIDTNEGFLHDPNDLGVVYATVRFTPHSSPSERQRIVNRERDRIAAELRSIAAGERPLSPEERRIRALWGPEASAARLREAADDIRFQLGQSNRFKAGLIRSGAWHHAIAHALAEHGLPPQLAALPLVESAYNPRAFSKDGAAGLWQFMPSTARRFLRMGAAVDQRFDPFSATVAAAQLLAYNHRILGTWPLAITAYNQGVAGMLRAVHTVGTRNIATIVRRYHSATFGFASRNFYVSFLAALYVEQHAQRYFGDLRMLPEERFDELTLPGYVSVAALERALEVSPARLRELNPALRGLVWDGELDVPRGYRLRLPRRGPHWSVAALMARLGPHALLAGQLRPPTYRVRWGDTLSGIAARYHLSIWTLARFNGMPVGGLLRVGEQIRLPGASRPPAQPVLAAAVPTAAASTASAVHPAVYRVRPGDTLSGIAVRYGVNAAVLAHLNDIPANGLLRIGEALHLPDATPAAQVAAVGPAAAMKDGPMATRGARVPQAAALVAQATSARSAAAAGAIPVLAAAQPGARSRRSPRGTDRQPVSAHQAEALGPMLGAESEPARSVDPTDYSVSARGTIRVATAESLGFYAEWLDVSAMDLRRINHIALRQPVRIGERIRLDFRHVTAQQFEQRRIAYHRALQASYFASHRIEGTRHYVTRSGDSLWTLTQRFAGLPAWLLRQYNPDTDFYALRPGTRLVIPRIITARAAG